MANLVEQLPEICISNFYLLSTAMKYENKEKRAREWPNFITSKKIFRKKIFRKINEKGQW